MYISISIYIYLSIYLYTPDLRVQIVSRLPLWFYLHFCKLYNNQICQDSRPACTDILIVPYRHDDMTTTSSSDKS